MCDIDDFIKVDGFKYNLPIRIGMIPVSKLHEFNNKYISKDLSWFFGPIDYILRYVQDDLYDLIVKNYVKLYSDNDTIKLVYAAQKIWKGYLSLGYNKQSILDIPFIDIVAEYNALEMERKKSLYVIKSQLEKYLTKISAELSEEED